jgi:hypothetical protein
LVFEKGMVSRYQIDGYSKRRAYRMPYHLQGTNKVGWGRLGWWHGMFYRENLNNWNDPCSIPSKNEIFKKLDAIIAAAKKEE